MKRLLLALALAAAGCGYHVGGHSDLIPRDIKTIAIPAFTNATVQYRLARMLPADLTREFISRTHYTIVADPSQADAMLTGVLVRYGAFPTTSDPTTGRATSAQVIVTLNLTLTDRRTGKALYSQVGLEFRDRYEISVDPTAYFDESGTAIERVSRDVGRKVVTDILEAF
jgi:outer membrane lipopolysaccharide assembly protein LptE/RlpB